jgi:hypothetical protein
VGLAYFLLFAALPPCTGDKLMVRLASEDTSKDRREVTVALKNKTSQACTLEGFASVKMMDRNDRPMNLEFLQDQADPLFPREQVRRVRLNPGEEASFYMGFLGVDAQGKPCAQSARLQVSPPAGGAPVAINAALAPCGTSINLSPVHEGVLKSSTSPNHPMK